MQPVGVRSVAAVAATQINELKAELLFEIALSVRRSIASVMGAWHQPLLAGVLAKATARTVSP